MSRQHEKKQVPRRLHDLSAAKLAIKYLVADTTSEGAIAILIKLAGFNCENLTALRAPELRMQCRDQDVFSSFGQALPNTISKWLQIHNENLPFGPSPILA